MPISSFVRFTSSRFLYKRSFTLYRSVAAMDSGGGGSSCTLILSGKSTSEKEIAQSLQKIEALKLPDNTEVSILLESEIAKPDKEECFNVELFFNSLSTTRFGRFLIWSPRLTSTHDVVSHNFCELPIGAVCVADVQYKGRGRSKNVWESPLGCLLFSFTVQMEDGRVVPLLQYVVSLAVTEAIKDICHKSGLPILDVKIKWPNDLYLNGLKVGGILCTSTYKSKKFNVSAGIGLNVNNEKPTTCLNAAIRELSTVAKQLRREDIIAAFFNKFENLYDIFIKQGFQTLEELYYRTWLHSGQRVIIQEKNGDQIVEHAVTIQGLTSSGYLLAIGEDCRMCELHPDGNSPATWQAILAYEAQEGYWELPCSFQKFSGHQPEHDSSFSTSSKDWSEGNLNEEDSSAPSTEGNMNCHVGTRAQQRMVDFFFLRPMITEDILTMEQSKSLD